MSVVIRGIGAVSALGADAGALREALFEGRHGIGEITRFDTRPFGRVRLGGCVAEGASCVEWAVAAALEAWADAGPKSAAIPASRVAVVAGTTEGEEGDIPGIARAVAEAIGARGPQWTISTACTSSANAIGLGKDLLDRGDADLVVAGGAERLAPEMFAGFYRLGVLAEEPCAPFGEIRGTTLAEGAGFLVLERAGASDHRPWAFLHGYGLASDAWHETSPEPRGGGIARASRGALGDAGLGPSSIDYVNVHGTGTAANDDSEWRGIRSALGSRAAEIPLSASKSYLGHAQGAAGVLELIATLVCMREGTVAPTLRVGSGRPNGPPDPVAAQVPRLREVRHLLLNSSAFGGANAVLCVGRDATPPRATPRRVARITGLGVCAFAASEPRDESHVRKGLSFELRGTDPSARLSLAAAHRALGDAGIRIRGALRDRAGVFAGSSRVSPTSLAEFRASIEEGGLERCSAAAFARLVLHAPAGTVSRLFELRGPTTTVAGDGIAGLMAIAYAADTVMRRDDADLMLAVGFDERATDEAREGAACVVIEAGAGRGPQVAGIASAGAGDLDGAIDQALSRAGTRREDVASWHISRTPDAGAPSLASAHLVVDAVRALREGVGLAVVGAAGSSASCVMVLVEERDEGR